MYLIGIVGRDRRALLEGCLARLEQARRNYARRTEVWFALDPLCAEYRAGWLHERGVDAVMLPRPEADAPPRERVAHMRCRLAAEACRLFRPETWLVNLDADVAVDPDFFARLDDVIASGAAFDPCGAVAMGNYAGYLEPGYLVSACPGGISDVRTHGLGGCLAFPLTDKLAGVAAAGVQKGHSWDSFMCRTVAGRRVLTSRVSYVRHLGVHEQAGMCAAKHPGLDWHEFSPALREVL